LFVYTVLLKQKLSGIWFVML